MRRRSGAWQVRGGAVSMQLQLRQAQKLHLCPTLGLGMPGFAPGNESCDHRHRAFCLLTISLLCAELEAKRAAAEQAQQEAAAGEAAAHAQADKLRHTSGEQVNSRGHNAMSGAQVALLRIQGAGGCGTYCSMVPSVSHHAVTSLFPLPDLLTG